MFLGRLVRKGKQKASPPPPAIKTVSVSPYYSNLPDY